MSDRRPGPRWEINDAILASNRVSSDQLGDDGGIVFCTQMLHKCCTNAAQMLHKCCTNGASVRLRVAGEVRGDAVNQLATLILDAMKVDLANEVLIDLDDVRYLDSNGVLALVLGYMASIEFGTTYRVVNARDQVQRTLLAAGVLDVLADSQDLGALVLALLSLPPTRRHS